MGEPKGWDRGAAIDVDAAGNVYVTGIIGGSVDFDPGPDPPLGTQGDADVFVLKLDSAGNYQWARAAGGTDFDAPIDIHVDDEGNVWTVGFVHNLVDFDPSPGGTAELTADAIGGVASIHLDGGNDSASLTVGSGDHEFQAPVQLDSDTRAEIGLDSILTFNNALSLNGNQLTKRGEGEVVINNVLSTGGGSVLIQEGTVSGGGSIGGDVTNDGGTVSPGNSLSIFVVNGTFSPASADVSATEVGDGRPGAANDQLGTIEPVNLGGIDFRTLDHYSTRDSRIAAGTQTSTPTRDIVASREFNADFRGA